ncbi:MAG: hypothetical protein IJA60_02740 [Clostridia bacterium]|nr:hypothetical protein [Clostridia bacterium]
MSFFERKEAEPSIEYLLEQKEQEIKETWLLVQNEAECDFCDADITKMEKLLADLKHLEEDRANLLEALDRKEAWIREAMCHG